MPGDKGKNQQLELTEKESKKKQMCPNASNVKEEEDSGVLKLMGQQMAGGLLKFSGKTMTLDQKQAALKKRSSVDYEKNIKDRKHEMWKKTFGRGDEKPRKK